MHTFVTLQKRAVRSMTRSPYCAALNPLFVRLRLLKVNDIYTLQLATFMFMFKFIRFLLLSSCETYFSLTMHHRTKHSNKRSESWFDKEVYRT